MRNEKHSSLWSLSFPARQHIIYINKVLNYTTVLHLGHFGQKAEKIRASLSQNCEVEKIRFQKRLPLHQLPFQKLCLTLIPACFFRPRTTIPSSLPLEPLTMLPGNRNPQYFQPHWLAHQYCFSSLLHQDLSPCFLTTSKSYFLPRAKLLLLLWKLFALGKCNRAPQSNGGDFRAMDDPLRTWSMKN